MQWSIETYVPPKRISRWNHGYWHHCLDIFFFREKLYEHPVECEENFLFVQFNRNGYQETNQLPTGQWNLLSANSKKERQCWDFWHGATNQWSKNITVHFTYWRWVVCIQVQIQVDSQTHKQIIYEGMWGGHVPHAVSNFSVGKHSSRPPYYFFLVCASDNHTQSYHIIFSILKPIPLSRVPDSLTKESDTQDYTVP